MPGVKAAQRRTTCREQLSSGAFTLVELLVVIAIIGVLVSLLMPALGAARRRAEAVRCLMQLRSIGMAGQQYALANRNALPGQYFYDATAGYAEKFSLTPYLDIPVPTRSPTIFTCAEIFARWPYYRSYGRTRAINGFGYRWTRASSGSPTSDPDNQRLADKPHKLSEIPSPSAMYFIADSVYSQFYSDEVGHYYYSDIRLPNFATAAVDHPERYVHLDALNFSFMDGHAQSVSRAEMQRLVQDSADPFWRGGYLE
ncbi:MAG: type II secretion system GspH family protein [Candidatus Marinimicrobia bacterium]|nr:type II secretion system GspH family protein [Candidatus Neomarinimicrobiota bacterium]